ncbi:MAG: lumazine-binding protein [Bacteroidota bacterium]
MNQKFLPFFIALFLSLSLISCSSNSPKAVAEKFLLSVARADLDEAKKLCDSNTRELLDQANYLTMVPDSVKAEGRNLKINIIDVKETGDKAVVTYKTSKLEENQIITLVKVDGKWLVQLDKMQEYDDEQPMLTESNEVSADSTAVPAADTNLKAASDSSTQ